MMALSLIPMIGFWELLLILLIILIIFGVGKLPEIGGALGKGIRNFKKGLSGETQKDEAKKLTEGEEKETG